MYSDLNGNTGTVSPAPQNKKGKDLTASTGDWSQADVKQ